jgi:hypothetical protein
MTFLLAILVSGVLLDSSDRAMPEYHIAFTSKSGELIEATTGKDGKFYVALPPGTHRFQIRINGTNSYYPELEKAEIITVDKNTSTLKLKHPAPPPPPHVIEIIQGTQRSIILFPPAPPQPPEPHVIEKPLYSPIGPRG